MSSCFQRVHTPFSSQGGGGSDVLSVSLSVTGKCAFLKVPNGGSQLGARPCVVVVTSRAVLVQVAARIWASLIRKTLFATHGCPDVPEFPHRLAQFDALGPSKVHTRTHHTRLISSGWARFVAGVQMMKLQSSAEGESTVTEETEHRPCSHTVVHARDVCFAQTDGRAAFFISENLRLLSMSHSDRDRWP